MIPTERGEESTGATWLWLRGNWAAFCLEFPASDGMLFSKVMLIIKWMPSLNIFLISDTNTSLAGSVTKPSDQPWFGFLCRKTAAAKYKSSRCKRHPTVYNRNLFRKACLQMEEVQNWAISWRIVDKKKCHQAELVSDPCGPWSRTDKVIHLIKLFYL